MQASTILQILDLYSGLLKHMSSMLQEFAFVCKIDVFMPEKHVYNEYCLVELS